jgi:hypothetical protein
MVFMARAAAPMFPGRLVSTNTNRKRLKRGVIGWEVFIYNSGIARL